MKMSYRYSMEPEKEPNPPTTLAQLTKTQEVHHTADPPIYSYKECASNGPASWGTIALECLGDSQSPINIISSQACQISPPASEGLKIFRWDEVPTEVVLQNAGSSFKLLFNYKYDGIPSMCGGPLEDDVYIFAELHFHWSSTSQEGSEHYINGKSSAAEGHAVFYNRKYGSLKKSLAFPDGLAVIGRLFDNVNSNRHYFPFASKLKHITHFNQAYTFVPPFTFTLCTIMGPVGFDYYMYQGSLTTPPCSQAVTWIVIAKTKKISTADLEELRKLRNARNEWMTPNFRRLQPVNGRVLFYFKR